jgi:hypothetical protein
MWMQSSSDFFTGLTLKIPFWKKFTKVDNENLIPAVAVTV